jgi:hypothetical protein
VQLLQLVGDRLDLGRLHPAVEHGSGEPLPRLDGLQGETLNGSLDV